MGAQVRAGSENMVPRWLIATMSRSRMKSAAMNPLTLQGYNVARPAGEIDDGIGQLLRRPGGYVATMSLMVRPVGRPRFSGTTR
jgi:hypothetical protein